MVNNPLVSIIIDYDAFKILSEENKNIEKLLNNLEQFYWEIYVEESIFKMLIDRIYWTFKNPKIYNRMVFCRKRKENLYNKIKYLNTFINNHKLLSMRNLIIYCGVENDDSSKISEECPFLTTSNPKTLHKIMEGL